MLGVLTITGQVTLWQVFGLAPLLGLNNCFENPARQSFVLEMVGPAHLRNAVSLNAVLVNVARAVGPAVAGLLIAAGGTGLCFLLNAASFVAVVFTLAIPRPQRPHARGADAAGARASCARAWPTSGARLTWQCRCS